MTLPEIQRSLRLLAGRLRALSLTLQDDPARRDVATIAHDLTVYAEQISRRRPRHIAPVSSRRMTPQLAAQLRAYKAAHPEVTYQAVANLFNVNTGRVSESLRGKRR